MAAMSSGKQASYRRPGKKGTASAKKFRFESFNQRISKLSIDPIRAPRRMFIEDSEPAQSFSYLGLCLKRWKDLNLSATFTECLPGLEPFCNTLPQVVHHQQDIFSHLVKCIEKRDPLSLEPLLDLLSNFAHDLGVRFEDHFLRTVTLLASLATSLASVEVIEWSFNCMAWLFKFLSRILVPNLRPLFAVMAPLLGKEQQKIHITRFAAEAMSFLIRQAATRHAHDERPLNIFMDAMKNDLLTMSDAEECKANKELYQHGLMTLLFNSIKGVERNLDSRGVCIYRCLLLRVQDSCGGARVGLGEILRGITVALIHHTESKTFRPILNAILENISQLEKESGNSGIAICAHLLFVSSTVRNGSRIQDWSPLQESMLKLLELCSVSDDGAIEEIYKASATILQSSPMEQVFPVLHNAMKIIASKDLAHHFLPFCLCFSALGKERFRDLILPYFCKFVNSRWREYEPHLCFLIPMIVGSNSQTKFACPDAWQGQILQKTQNLPRFKEDAIEYYSRLEVWSYMSLSPKVIEQSMTNIAHSISGRLDRFAPSRGNGDHGLWYSIVWYARHITDATRYHLQWWPRVADLATQYASWPLYLEAVLILFQVSDISHSDEHVDKVARAAIENLRSASHDLRSLSLRILHCICIKCPVDDSQIIATALAIENSALDLQSARSISVQIRNLASRYEAASSHQWLGKAIPHFLFGLLTYKLSQAQEDAVLGLKQICDVKAGEDIVSELAFAWLENESLDKSDGTSSETQQVRSSRLDGFECSNLLYVEKSLRSKLEMVAHPEDHLKSRFEAANAAVSCDVVNATCSALQVLIAIPHLAEKRSRRFVPFFLTWAMYQADKTNITVPDDIQDLTASAKDEVSVTFHQRDRKAMLDVLCLFTNPRVIYKSANVFEALRNLLSHGDVQIQRLALRALFTWKIVELQPYQEKLLNLLDDARFREELSTFLHVDEETSTVRQDHCAVLMPILLRLLYGRVITRTGAKGGQQVRRRAVLEALFRFGADYLGDFVDIALSPLNDLPVIRDSRLNEQVISQDLLSVRKQLGVVNMVKSMLETLGSRLFPFAHTIGNALIYCLVRASRQTSSRSDMPAEESIEPKQTSIYKVIQHTSVQCFEVMFRRMPPEQLLPYLPTLFAEVLSSRLEKLPIDSAQSVSSKLKIFSTFASSHFTAFFLTNYDARIIPSISECLDVPSAQDSVRIFVMDDILLRIIETISSRPDEEDSSPSGPMIRKSLCAHSETILCQVGSLLRKSPSKEVLATAIRLVSMFAPLLEGPSQTETFLEISTFLLDQPSHRVSPKSKGELLKIAQNFVRLAEGPLSAPLHDRLYHTISSLFGYFKDRSNRLILSQVMTALAEKDTELQEVAQVCAALNSYSTQRLDEPDFAERLRAFNLINEKIYGTLSPKQWRPLLYNMLFYVKDADEIAIRINASFALRRFAETNVVDLTNLTADSSFLTRSVLLPALRSGASEPSELIRAEYLSVIAHLIRHNPQWHEINDMIVLLADYDEEASFFTNILHIQQHRRLRALRRLAVQAGQRQLHSANVAHFFIPLIEHFIFEQTDDEHAHNIMAETIKTIGVLSSSLEWSQYRAMFRRFSSYIQSKPSLVKTVVKLLSAIIDALRQSRKDRTVDGLLEANSGDNQIEVSEVDRKTLALTMPRQEKFAQDLMNGFLPSLERYLHDKEESTVSLRVPVAISVVKLLKLLPPNDLRSRLPPVLTDVCNILRSRAQESRDLTRKTLVEISTLIGPDYFGFVLNELRNALARGYQLHVLSFTVHSILVATADDFKPGDIDYCLPRIVAVIVDDIFGTTGQEKDAEDYISKMKEVKSRKSYDSMELVAKTATVENLKHLVKPVQSLLTEKLDLRMIRKIDELLRRIGAGLLRNEAAKDQRFLVFCHEMFREVHRIDTSTGKTAKEDHRTRRLLINQGGADRTNSQARSSSHSYKLARFALDLLRMILQKYDSLRTPSNLAGFIPIIGDAIVSPNEELQTSALRLLIAVIQVPLKSIDDNATIYVAECVRIVRASASTKAELSQAALKLVSVILRERRTVQLREKDLAYLLTRLIPDLEVPEKQGVAFNFLKAIMTHKIVMTEVYEVLDVVAVIMVTNQAQNARDMARGALFQFIKDYPHSKARFAKQLSFVVTNLTYPHQEGRQSVMELVHLLFTKLGEALVQEIMGAFFLPLITVVTNDDASTCREMAGALLKTCFERADPTQNQSFLALLRSLLNQPDRPLLNRVALQVYGMYLDTNGTKAEKELSELQSKVAQIIKTNLMLTSDVDWELLYYALQAFSKVCQLQIPSAFGSPAASLWASVRQCLSFPHAWVKLSAARLLGTYFADFARVNASSEEMKLPLKGSGGLWLREQEIVETTRASLNILKVPQVSQDLADQSVRILVFLAKMMAQTAMPWHIQNPASPVSNINEDEQEAEEDDDSLGEGTSQSNSSRTALAYLMSRISFILRRPPLNTRSPALIPHGAALRLVGALVASLPLPAIVPHMRMILLPLQNYTDTAVAAPFSTDQEFVEGYRDLVRKAQEIQASLQKLMGPTDYINALQSVKEEVKGRREDRRAKRRIEAVAQPEKAGKLKQRKGEKKREKRKARSGEEQSRRRGW